jgi:peroxiredoxin
LFKFTQNALDGNLPGEYSYSMLVSSFMVPLGTPAPDFSLPSLDETQVSLADFADAPALLVIFASNQCPHVRHIETQLGVVLSDYSFLGVVGICPNDAAQSPENSPAELAAQVVRAGWRFPYLLDESQTVVKAYRAACTPDFFLYDENRRLVYRGAFDYSTPGNRKRVTGDLLRFALERTLCGQPVPEPHRPSMGCSIKWKPGNEPADEDR